MQFAGQDGDSFLASLDGFLQLRRFGLHLGELALEGFNRLTGALQFAFQLLPGGECRLAFGRNGLSIGPRFLKLGGKPFVGGLNFVAFPRQRADAPFGVLNASG